MGIRFTGVSTPFFGFDWEYTDTSDARRQQQIGSSVYPQTKLKVFISSMCGVEKYDIVRKELKKKIEDTQLAHVYLFEDSGSSTISAEDHYIFALQDSDVCIFLIDNLDGVRPGVQKEVEAAKKNNIKSFFYFCNENKKEKTELEKSMMGASFAKSSTISRFSDLIEDGSQDLINEIVKIYHYYCKGMLLFSKRENDLQSVSSFSGAHEQQVTIPKAVLKKTDKSKKYLLEFVMGYPPQESKEKEIETSDADEWCLQFLMVLLGGKSIKEFNLGMYLDTLKERHSEGYLEIVKMRWHAIQAYFNNDIQKCVSLLERVLDSSKKTKQPLWVTKDILIDLRNISNLYDETINAFRQCAAQKELDDSEEEIYYPHMDRLNNSLHEIIIQGLIKDRTKSPYTVTLGSDLESCVALIISDIIVAMYNGSLTHLIILSNKLKELFFYLNCMYDDWQFRRGLFMLTIYSGNQNEVTNIQNCYPEILNSLNANDAKKIMDFCNNHPIWHQRISSQLVAFGSVGYYLDEKEFDQWVDYFYQGIKRWADDRGSIVVGNHIFPSLANVAYRIDQNILAMICCIFIRKDYSRWYDGMFRLINTGIDLNKMSLDSQQTFIKHIKMLFDSDDGKKCISQFPYFLETLRRQNREITQELDEAVNSAFPEYYLDHYKLATTENTIEDYPRFVAECVERMKQRNKTQGKNGQYVFYFDSPANTIHSIIKEEKCFLDDDLTDAVIDVAAHTLLHSNEIIRVKVDVVSLLICMIAKYPNSYQRKKAIYQKLIDDTETILQVLKPVIESNIDSMAMAIALQILDASRGNDVSDALLEMLSCIQNDDVTTISVVRTIASYLDIANKEMIPERVETIILYKAMEWLLSKNIEIRKNATFILLFLLRNPANRKTINRQLIKLVDSDNVYIKNIIIRHLFSDEGIFESTKQYILLKCKDDPNYVVRTVCQQQMKATGFNMNAKDADTSIS